MIMNHEFSLVIMQFQYLSQLYLRSTYTDHTGVVPASRVAEDHNDHEHPCHQLEDATELEQADGGGEADGQPHHHSQDSDHHC